MTDTVKFAGIPCVQWLTILILSSFLGYCSATEFVANCNSMSQLLVVHVPENTTVGYVIAKVSAYDLKFQKTDHGDTFNSLLNTTKLQNGLWEISVNESLDTETIDALEFTFLCRDTQSSEEFHCPVNLVIDDINEFGPQFEDQNVTIGIQESAEIGAPIYTVKASDLDDQKAPYYNYAIIQGADGYFKMARPSSGVITLVKPLDYEKGPRQFVLNISATESLPDGITNYTSLTINVIDVDDLMPVFLDDLYHLTLPEGNYTGNTWFKTVPALSARDGDYYLNQTIQFEIDKATQTVYHKLFNVANNGSIGIDGRLNIGTYSILVVAYQTDKPLLRRTTTVVTVTVTDVNDHTPSMSSTQYTASLSEAAAIGTVVLTVTATDEDLGNNSVLEFHLDNSVHGIFIVETNHKTGIICLNSSIDREQKNEYNFQIWAEETMTLEHYKSSNSSVHITVLDENDNSPQFNQSEYIFNITKAFIKGDVIGQVSANDSDDGVNAQLTYAIKISLLALNIDNTGKITLTKNVSSSETGTYNFIVSATDGAVNEYNRRTSFAVVLVNILPDNTNEPVFVNTPYIFNIYETTKPGSPVGQVTTHDGDGNTIQYSIPGNSYFQVNSTSGEITLIKDADLDVDTAPTNPIDLKVSATDGLHKTEVDVRINFMYVNEFPPEFVHNMSPVQLLENATQDTVITKVTATDSDKGPDVMTYSIVTTTTSTMFKINSSTGEIKLNCSSCLTNKIYDIIVQVSDGGSPPRYDTMSLQLDVTKTEFEPPHFYEKIYHVLLPENLPTQTILQLSATDPSNLLLKFNSTNQASPKMAESLLHIFENGTVNINCCIDAENITYFTVDVTVTNGHATDVATIEVNITDLNDNNPTLIFNTPLPVLIPENSQIGKIVTTIGANDKDVTNSGFSFFLADGADGKFHIDVKTGEITLAELLDRRKKSVYNLTIHVLDHGFPPAMGTGNLLINISDSNIAPQFTSASKNSVSSYDFSVKENLTIGELIGSLYASDPDFGSSGELTFKLQAGNSTNMFSLEENTGNLTLARSLNYDHKQVYVVIAVVSDNSVKPKSSSATVTIHVENVVEAPQWAHDLAPVYITQSSICRNQQLYLQASSREVTKVSSYSDGYVEYYIVNKTKEFSINNTTGQLTIINALPEGSYTLQLSACNNGTTVCSYAFLPVVVENEGVLAFCPTFYHIEVNESTQENVSILDMNTTLSDSSVIYNISSGNLNFTFGIRANNGELYINKKLDRETVPSYILLVSAKNINNQEEAQAQVIITVLDAPDEKPIFSASLYKGTILESDATDVPVINLLTNSPLIISATDPDESPQMVYSIDPNSDTSNGSFKIANGNAILSAKKIDYESIDPKFNKSYTFNVLVTDGIFMSNVTVIVSVIDIDDNPPTFDSPDDMVFNVTEGPTSIQDLGFINATDPDTNPSLIYMISAVHPADAKRYFYIDKSSGQFGIIRELDYESENEYILNVSVTDGKYTISKLVTVNVIDINDNSPYFNQIFNMTVTEGDAGLDTNVSIFASDADAGINGDLTYRIIAGNVNNSFQFDTKVTNVLKTIRPLDREAIGYSSAADILLIIEAVDKGQPPRSGTGTVAVTIKDVNDNPPRFSQRTYYAEVSEDVMNVSVVLSPPFNVTNVDIDDCPSYIFSLSSNSTPFIINITTGELSVHQQLNRKKTASYTLWITAVDDCGHGLNSSANIIIRITDVNDEAPHFVYNEYKFNISKKATIFQTVGTVTATKNGTNVAYFLNKSNNMFFINSSTGNIQLVRDLDRGNTNEYILNVSACDVKLRCSSAIVYIHVTDTSDSCPEWNMTSLNMSVVEGSNPWLQGHISVLNNDVSTSNVVNYYLNDTGGTSYIEINNSTGELRLLKKLRADKLDQSTYTFSVYAQNNAQPPCILPGTLKITVLGTNDNDPEICYQGKCGVTDIQLSVPDQSLVGTILALIATRDNDTGLDGEVNLTLKSQTPGLIDIFSLSDNGILSLQKQLNLTDLKNSGNVQNDTVDLILMAKDKGQDPHFTNASVKVKVVVVLPGYPMFTKNSFQMTVKENENNGSYVGVVSATSTAGVHLDYSISTAIGSVPFKINQNNGTITTNTVLDREKRSSYIFTVQATNSSEQNQYASAVVMVSIEDVNESPTFDHQNITVNVKEGVSPITLATLTAHDGDEGLNGIVTYTLLNASLYSNFLVNQSTGVLSVTANLDREKFPAYDLTVQAVDGGSPPLTASVFIHVTVLDINDNAPKFTESSYHCNISKSQPPIKVIQVTANDDDDGENKKIIYLLESIDYTFTINPLNGEIQTIAVPTSESYTLVVMATDEGSPPLNSTAMIIVKVVENTANNVPILSMSTNFLQLFVGMTAGTELHVDITTKYSQDLQISGTNGTDLFIIENDKIVLRQNLILESLYVLNIVATSTTSNNVSQELVIRVDIIKFTQQSYAATVIENSNSPQMILDINSYAEQNGIPVNYFLLDDYNSAFYINSSTGALWVLKALDREKYYVYELVVGLSLDHSISPTHSRYRRSADLDQATAHILVRVEDQNDNIPSFDNLGPELLLSIPEDVNVSYLITTLKAFDLDEGFNGLIRYSISSGDNGAFYLDPVTGEIRVACPEKIRGNLTFALTVQAIDRNGTGNSSSLNIKISIIQDSYQFRLSTLLPISILKDNLVDILRGLSDILGFSLSTPKIVAHEESGVVYSDRSDILFRVYAQHSTNVTTYISSSEISKKVSEQQTEIDKLLKSFMVQPKTNDDDTWNAVSISLIAVACAMFFATLVAIFVACRMWRRQKKNSKKEEESKNWKNIMENYNKEDNMKSRDTNSENNIEMIIISEQEVTQTTSSEIPQIQEREVNQRLEQMQQSLSELASESLDSGIASPLSSESEGNEQDPLNNDQEGVKNGKNEFSLTADNEETHEERSRNVLDDQDAVKNSSHVNTNKSDTDENKEIPQDYEDDNELEKQIPETATSSVTRDNSLGQSSKSPDEKSIFPKTLSSNGFIPHNSNPGLSIEEHQDTDNNNSVEPQELPGTPLGLNIINKTFLSEIETKTYL